MRRTVLALIVAAGLVAPALAAQTAQPDAAITEVRQTRDAARKAIETYIAGGGKAGTADHPALTWEATLWSYRDRYPRSVASAIATTEAVRLLVRAELWDRAHARVGSVGFDDTAWERLPPVIYDEGIARKDLPSTIATLSRAVSETTTPSIKAAALVVIGRAYRRQGDREAATRSLEAAKTAAPASLYAEEAEGLIYEIAHLSPGMEAPPVKGQARDGRPVDLAALRGKPVVLVFWGTT